MFTIEIYVNICKLCNADYFLVRQNELHRYVNPMHANFMHGFRSETTNILIKSFLKFTHQACQRSDEAFKFHREAISTVSGGLGRPVYILRYLFTIKLSF